MDALVNGIFSGIGFWIGTFFVVLFLFVVTTITVAITSIFGIGKKGK